MDRWMDEWGEVEEEEGRRCGSPMPVQYSTDAGADADASPETRERCRSVSESRRHQARDS